MFCSQCGKKVLEAMLFCPFCGSPIVIPDQEDGAEPEAKPAKEPKIEISKEDIFEPAEARDEDDSVEFIPLDMNQVWQKPAQPPEEKVEKAPSKSAPNEKAVRQPSEEPVRLQGRKPDLSAARPHGAPKIASRKAADTYVPQRQFDPDNIFLDEEEEDDSFEDYEDENEYEYEEPEHGSFFVRHIRGCVSLILFAVVAVVVLGWMLSGSGQQALARAGFAWNPKVYAEVAIEAYQNGSYALAGNYYVEALERDADNYDYANYAGVSYLWANDSLNAEAMARKAIEIDPTRSEAYELLLRLYPDAEVRPLEIQGLIQTGYELTGNANLNINQ